MRKLVTIRRVDSVAPIEGADAIECLTIEGWKVVSQKGNFVAGDQAVYFEIDSFLPDGNPLWQDLVDRSSRMFEGKKGHVLRTIKLRGQVSQGFAIPLRKFPEIQELIPVGCPNPASMGEGEFDAWREQARLRLRERDFADVLGVVKYEAPIPAELAGQVKGSFPSSIRKTDQERVQNMPEVFNNLEAEYEVSVKLDGTSVTVYVLDGEVGVCSRNLELKINDENKDNTLVKLAALLTETLQGVGGNYAIQGELMGPGIQGNREALKEPTFFVFDIYSIDKAEYVTPQVREWIMQILTKNTNGAVKHVPILHKAANLRDLNIQTMDAMLAFAEGPSITHPIREGLVFKRADGKVSFKAISNKFLLKAKDGE